MAVPDPTQAQALIEMAARESKTPEAATILMVAALTGMRRGEACRALGGPT